MICVQNIISTWFKMSNVPGSSVADIVSRSSTLTVPENSFINIEF